MWTSNSLAMINIGIIIAKATAAETILTTAENNNIVLIPQKSSMIVFLRTIVTISDIMKKNTVGKITKFMAHFSTHIPMTNADPNDWIIDSACNVFLTPFKDRITHYKEFAHPQNVAGLDGKT